jgi:hypothetical protein
MPKADWLEGTSPAFRLIIATSWLAPDSWQENQEKAIREAVAAGPDWAEYLRLVDRHQITSLSWAALSRVSDLTIPEPIRQQLHKLSDACRIRAVQHCLLLTDVLKGFNGEGVPVMPLKGPVLSFALYGDVGLRQSSDLDVAVAKDDLKRGQVCLESMGWQLDPTISPMSPRQWESFMRIEHHMNFTHSHSGRSLELHWRNYWETPDATNAWWERSIQSEWQRCSIHIMSPGDLALYLCRHGGVDAWSSAKLLGDLARAHSLGLLDWAAAFDEAHRSNQENVLLAGLCLLDKIYRLQMPEMSGTEWQNQSLQLTEIPLQLLRNSEGTPAGTGLASLRNTLRMSHYERLLCPRKTLTDRLSELLYCREDFSVLPLPDGLFWAYKPLRLFLWIRRWALQTWRKRSNHDAILNIQTRA